MLIKELIALFSAMQLIKPGIFELYFGPMTSGKTKALIDRVEKIRYMPNHNFVFFAPECNSRDAKLQSRFGAFSIDCVFVKSPEEILARVEEIEQKIPIQLVGIDEVQFFPNSIRDVIVELLKRSKNVVAGGLNLDFRGEPFGCMPYVLSIANEYHPLTAVCGFPACIVPATRTQRLINGNPAPYDAPIVSVEGVKSDETYQARCIFHHKVPKRMI